MPISAHKVPDGADDENKADDNVATKRQLKMEAEDLRHIIDTLQLTGNTKLNLQNFVNIDWPPFGPPFVGGTPPSTSEGGYAVIRLLADLHFRELESRLAKEDVSALTQELNSTKEKLKDVEGYHKAKVTRLSNLLNAETKDTLRFTGDYLQLRMKFGAALHRGHHLKQENEKLKANNTSLQLRAKEGQAVADEAAKVKEEVLYLRGKVQALNNLKHENIQLKKQKERSRIKQRDEEIQQLCAELDELQTSLVEKSLTHAPNDETLTQRYFRTLKTTSSKLTAMSQRISAMTDADRAGAGWCLVEQQENVVKAHTRDIIKDIDQSLALGGEAGRGQARELDENEFPALGASLKTTTAAIAGSSGAPWGSSSRSPAPAGRGVSDATADDRDQGWTTVSTRTSPRKLKHDPIDTAANPTASASTTSNKNRVGQKSKT
ncbi:uncharacterized protein A1O9_09468 [Exophiala aquamarina CBS 119918]|uniref:Uncharacterized protein n=1 Tax=Exophiala aquamarina CBS 119918 TaxID=1182545 RepID=A0A072P3P8_9EURO|nr:uncharacterized protein A1O9_09468 [Exophiala aquamarina CBS 119918]KEF54302.1 hypothetical protein A1O9_09468 [Exophiala aquamarina CBS 119918]